MLPYPAETSEKTIDAGIETPDSIHSYIKKMGAKNNRQQKKIMGILLGVIDFNQEADFPLTIHERQIAEDKIAKRENQSSIIEKINNIELPKIEESIEEIQNSTLNSKETKKIGNTTIPIGYKNIISILANIENTLAEKREDYLENPELLRAEIERIQKEYPDPREFIKKQLMMLKSDDVYRLQAAKYSLLSAIYGKRWEYHKQLEIMLNELT